MESSSFHPEPPSCTLFFFKIFISSSSSFYLAAQDLSCSMQDLQPSLAACGIFSCSMQNLVPWPGFETSSPALGTQSLSHCTTLGKTPIPFYYLPPVNHNVLCQFYLFNVLKPTLYFCFHSFRICHGEGNGTPLQYSCLENPMDGGAWWAAVCGVARSQIRLSDFTFTFHFYALEKEMATHSSVLAWRIPGTGEPGGLPSMGSHRVGHDWSDLAGYVMSVPDFCNGLVPGLSATKFALLQFILHRFTKIDVVNANLIVSLFCLNSLIVPHCYEVELC